MTPFSSAYRTVKYSFKIASCSLLTLGMMVFPVFTHGQAPSEPAQVAAAVPELARIPYAMVVKEIMAFQKLPVRDKLALQVTVTPRVALTEGEDPLILILKCKSGDRVIKQSASGELIDFPVDDALLAENPMIETNKPRGSLNLNITTVIAYPGKLTELVAWYRAAIEQLTEAVKVRGGNNASSKIAFLFPHPATVTLRIGNDEANLPLINGAYSLDLSEKGIPDKALIILSEVPTSILVIK